MEGGQWAETEGPPEGHTLEMSGAGAVTLAVVFDVQIVSRSLPADSMLG